MDLKRVLPQNLFDVVDRVGLSTRQIVLLSVWDIIKLANLCIEDVTLLKNFVAEFVSPKSITCDELFVTQNEVTISTGCQEFDEILRGGLRRGTITEIYGESGSGKTQVTLQAAAHNWSTGTIFFCTEDLFPVKRFQQIKQNITNDTTEKDYARNTFVEHITEANELISCVRVRLPHLLEKHNLSLIVLDSIAGPFRSEYSDYVQRAEALRELAMELLKLAQKFKVAILCVNQVTSAFDGTDDLIPSLGLAWSNMVNTRLWIKKTKNIFDMTTLSSESYINLVDNVYIRELCVVFSPSLPNCSVKFIITATGIKCI